MTGSKADAGTAPGGSEGPPGLTARDLGREEIGQVRTIDRSEVIENVYHLVNGTLVLRPERHDMRGWPRGEAEKYTPILLDCYDRGGWFRIGGRS